MMFQNGFVMAVKGQSKKVLREINGQVFLPFHSEYSLLLKNNNMQRCVCSVSIDGTDVLGGHEIIIDSHGSIDLERFMIDGDLNRGQKFKFVPLCDSRVQDPSSGENGIIEVKFWPEKNTTWYKPIVNSPTLRSFGSTIGSKEVLTSGGPIETMYNCDTAGPDMAFTCDVKAGTPGATVAGSDSQQSFSSGGFQGKDGAPTILRLQLVSQKQEVTAQETRKKYCYKCGSKAVFNDNFCSGCGAKLGSR